MEHFSYEGGCGVREYMQIEIIKRRVSLGYRQMAMVISNKMLFETVVPLRN